MNRAPASTRFIAPTVLARIRDLQLVSKTVVEGFLGGLHRSPYHGFSLDFAEYRQYAPGDDLRRVDWNVYARTDRFYVKKYEGDTNTQLYLLLDVSKSMDFSSRELTKLDYARYLAASLAYLAVRQKDTVGLITFDAGVVTQLPPRGRYGHFVSLLHYLEEIVPAGKSNIAGAIEKLSYLIRKRAMIVLISDFYQDVAEVTKALAFFHHRGNDVILFHILDPAEREIPFNTVSTLEDMETGETLPYAPEQSRSDYLAMLEAHIDRLRKECTSVRIDYQLLGTDEPLDRALYRYLSLREKRY